MKKYIFIGLSFYSLVINATLQIDPKTGIFYSKKTGKKVDEYEYHSLMVYIIQYLNNNPYATDEECFSFLRMIGTPTAKKLLNDLKKHAKIHAQDTKKRKKYSY